MFRGDLSLEVREGHRAWWEITCGTDEGKKNSQETMHKYSKLNISDVISTWGSRNFIREKDIVAHKVIEGRINNCGFSAAY